MVSGGEDNSVRVWDIASGTQLRQLAGEMFALMECPSEGHISPAPVECPSDSSFRTYLYVLTADDDTLRIYKVATNNASIEEEEKRHAEEGAAGAPPVACFKVRTISEV